MFRHQLYAVFLAILLCTVNAQAAPGPAPSGSVLAEYDWLTGEVVVSVADVNNWYIQSASNSLTGSAPVGLPAGGGLVSDHDGVIGETSLTTFSYTNLNLGNVAASGLPFNDLTINSNAGLGQPLLSSPVTYLNLPDNIPPTAQINGPFNVDVLLDPLNLLLDASSSFDDGKYSPLSYKWDLDNNGDFEHSTGTNPTFEIADVTSTFAGLGTFPVSVEVFDGEFSSTATTTVDLFNTPPPVNQRPRAHLNGPFSIDLFVDPLIISLDGSGSSDDGLHSPLTYTWDLDDDGIFEVDTGTTDFLDIPDVEATFGGVGTYPVSLQVYDGEFFGVAETSVELYSTMPPGNQPPLARIRGTFHKYIDIFDDPLSITLDGSSSRDDGDISPLTYTWDLDGDGVFETDTGNHLLYIDDVTSTFGGLGGYPVYLRVFDGEFYDDAFTNIWLVDNPVAEPGTAVVSYDPATGEIIVSVTGVNNWWIESASGGFTGDEPVFPGNGLSTNHDTIVGETGFALVTFDNFSLGNIAALNLSPGDLTINWNAGLGHPLQTSGVVYLIVPEPTTLVLATTFLCGLFSLRRRTIPPQV